MIFENIVCVTSSVIFENVRACLKTFWEAFRGFQRLLECSKPPLNPPQTPGNTLKHSQTLSNTRRLSGIPTDQVSAMILLRSGMHPPHSDSSPGSCTLVCILCGGPLPRRTTCCVMNARQYIAPDSSSRSACQRPARTYCTASNTLPLSWPPTL